MLRLILTITLLAAVIMPKAHARSLSTDSPAAPIPDQNPVTFGPIPTQFLVAGGESLVLDLSEYVSGLSSGTMRFELGSNPSTLVTVRLAGNQLTIKPVMAGNAQIEVSLVQTTPIDVSFDVVVLPGGAWSVSDDDDVYLLEGNVGIGVDDPDERLVVDGRIKAEEIHVEDVTPADYVFEDDYVLMSLDELKDHIQAHGHLPGIAPGPEMEAEGVSVSRMQTVLLEKVEELMLYTIDQHKTLVSQRRTIDEQERQLAVQQRHIESLEERLSKLEQNR